MLSETALQVLNAMRKIQAREKTYGPSMKEIADAIGMQGQRPLVHYYVTQLEHEGLVVLHPHRQHGKYVALSEVEVNVRSSDFV